MANQFLTSIDLNQNQIIDGRFEVLASAPGAGVSYEGRIYYDSTLDALRVYADGAWVSLIHNVSSTTTQLNASTSGNTIDLSLDASSSNIADYLVLRDGSGNFAAGTITATFSGNLTGNVTGQVSDISNHDTGDLTEGSNLYFTDARVIAAIAANTGDLDVNNQKITNLATPTNASDAATKGYVDGVSQGLDVKQSVRVATTGALSITTDLEAGDSVDNITLVAGDRVLVKNQASGAENGIYVVQASGAAVRADDANSNDDVTAGMFTFVEEGDTYADTGWVLTTNETITLGTTALAFAQFSGAGTYTAGPGLDLTGGDFSVNVDDSTIEIVTDTLQVKAAGIDESHLNASVAGDGLTGGGGSALAVGGTANRITVSADAVDIASTYVGQSSITTLGTIATGTWEATDVAVAHGGTGASTAADARDNLADTSTSGLTTSTPTLARISAQTIGDGSNVSYTVQHNFGTKDVVVQVYEIANDQTVFADVDRNSINDVVITFASAPATNTYRVVVTG
jgi:hypothetical protein